MSHLIVVSFDNYEEASSTLDTLQSLQKRHLIDLDDAAIVEHRNNGKVKLNQSINLVTSGLLGGSFWGLLIGVLFMSPIVGLVSGSLAGAAAGALSDVGIDDHFMKKLGEQLVPGKAALFILVRRATVDKVIDELGRFSGKIVHTSLSVDGEERLQRILEAKQKQFNPPALGVEKAKPEDQAQSARPVS